MCLETYFAVNLLADLILIGAVSRALGLFRGRRVLAAGGLCALYAVLCAARPRPWAAPPVQLAMLLLTGLMIAGRSAVRLRGEVILSLCAGALIGSGVAAAMRLSGIPAALLGTIAGGAAICALFAAHPPGVKSYQILVRIIVERRAVCFTALVDTGNRLREPVTGLPVLIAEAGLLKGALPAQGFRALRYGAVGGDGVMACFKPTSVWIGRGARMKRAPDAWVGVSPDPLPGVFRALAPSVYALYI